MEAGPNDKLPDVAEALAHRCPRSVETNACFVSLSALSCFACVFGSYIEKHRVSLHTTSHSLTYLCSCLFVLFAFFLPFFGHFLAPGDAGRRTLVVCPSMLVHHWQVSKSEEGIQRGI